MTSGSLWAAPRTAIPCHPEFSFEIISDSEHLAACRNIWDGLVEAAGISHPFLTHDWISAWWESFGAGHRLFILVVKIGSEPVAIAPLMLSRRRFCGVPLRTVEFIANSHTPRLDFIIAPGYSEAYGAIWTRLREMQPLWDVLMLSQIPGDSPALPELIGLAHEASCTVGLWLSATSPYLSTAVEFESYFQELKAKHRSEVRRRMRRLRELGDVDLEILCSQAGVEEALPSAFDLEGAAWKDGNGTSIRSSSGTLSFYSNIARQFASRGQFELQFLKSQDKRIAVNICLRYGNRIFLLKPGYDPEFASYSPGNLLSYLYFQQIFGAGIQEFDFLGDLDSWKREWTPNARRHYWLHIFSPGLLPSLVYVVKFGLLPPLQSCTFYHRARRLGLGVSRHLRSNCP